MKTTVKYLKISSQEVTKKKDKILGSAPHFPLRHLTGLNGLLESIALSVLLNKNFKGHTFVYAQGLFYIIPI